MHNRDKKNHFVICWVGVKELVITRRQPMLAPYLALGSIANVILGMWMLYVRKKNPLDSGVGQKSHEGSPVAKKVEFPYNSHKGIHMNTNLHISQHA